MTQKSQFWYTDGFTGAIGDGSAPYTQEEFRAYNGALLGEGVVAGADDELEVKGAASPLTVEAGRAQVNGFHYWNDAQVSLAVTTPSIGTTGGRVVLRADFTAATVRAAIITSADGTAAYPALTQSVGVTWEISLAGFTITTGGVITLEDEREFATTALAGIKLAGRQGGDPDDWLIEGTTDYAIPGNVIMQVGAIEQAAAANVTVTFPVEFMNTPAVFFRHVGAATVSLGAVNGAQLQFLASGGNVDYVQWMAIGIRL
jgi:hypothetical protein